jgi:hypothetical protein
MDFTVTSRTVDRGQFAILSSDGHPIAQVFVPGHPSIKEQFSFFWPAWSTRQHIHGLLRKLSQPQSEVKVRLIGRSYLTTFSVCQMEPLNQQAQRRNLDLVHQLIEAADLPYSLALAIDTSRHDWLSEVYVWASVTSEESGSLTGQPETGVRTTLHDWRQPAFREAVFPLLERTVELKEGVHDLWSKAAETARNLM